jgi:hypothetical protein
MADYFAETAEEYFDNKYKTFTGKELIFWILEDMLNKNNPERNKLIAISLNKLTNSAESLNEAREEANGLLNSYRLKHIIYNLENQLMNNLLSRFINNRILCCLPVMVIAYELLKKYNIDSRIKQGYMKLEGQFTWHFWLETNNHKYDVVYKIIENLFGTKIKTVLLEELPPGATCLSDEKNKELNRRIIQKFYEDPNNIWEYMKNDEEYAKDCTSLQFCFNLRNQLLQI